MSNIDLMEYLPDYYRESPQFRAIMDVFNEFLPDVEGEVWRNFFLHLSDGDMTDRWRDELGVDIGDDLFAKLRSQGQLTPESMRAQGFEFIESYRLMPEDGLVASGDGYMADGREFAPLTSTIFTTQDTIETAKGIVKLIGLAGFTYLLVCVMEAKATIPAARVAASSRTVELGSYRVEQYDDTASGATMVRLSGTEVHMSAAVNAKRTTWWSPNLTFFDNVRFIDDELTLQKSSVIQVD